MPTETQPTATKIANGIGTEMININESKTNFVS